MSAAPRPRPCASCPYRRNAPSGVWHPEEYAKLPRYDGDTASQPPQVFMCHQGDDHVCSGWLGHRDPWDLLAVRIGVLGGSLDASCAEYTTTVPLFGSGVEAAAHGLLDVHEPTDRAQGVMRKVALVRRGSAGWRGALVTAPSLTPLDSAIFDEDVVAEMESEDLDPRCTCTHVRSGALCGRLAVAWGRCRSCGEHVAFICAPHSETVRRSERRVQHDACGAAGPCADICEVLPL